jgi:hypothetical protein
MANAQEVLVEARTTAQRPIPDNAVRRLMIRSADTVRIGHLLRIEDSYIVSLPLRTPVQLPFNLPPLISHDGNTIVQFGDLTLLDEPQRLDLYWIDDEGEVEASLVGYYGGEAVMDVSMDGFAVAGGPLLETPDQASISTFSPSGMKLWETRLEEDRRVSQVYPTRGGRHVVSVTTDRDRWLEEHELEIYGPAGRLESSLGNLGIIQRVVLVGDDELLFFQGRSYHGMIEVATGRVLWRNPGKITMVSPYAAALSPDGRRLFLVIIQQEGRRRGPYSWEFVILDASTGQAISSRLLPDQYPATWERIFESVTDTSVDVLAGVSRVTLTIRTERGGPQ